VTVLREHEKEVYSVDWCHTGDKNLVVSGSWDSTAKVWNIESGMNRSLSSFAGHYGVVYSTVWSPHIPGCFASCSGEHDLFRKRILVLGKKLAIPAFS